MSVALRRLDGVVSADVRLNSGLAEVELAPGNLLDPERIRQTARDAGFTPKGAEVTVRGVLELEAGTRALRVTGPDLVFRLVSHSEAPAAFRELHALPAGSRVELVADWPGDDPSDPHEPVRRLRVRSLSRRPR